MMNLMPRDGRKPGMAELMDKSEFDQYLQCLFSRMTPQDTLKRKELVIQVLDAAYNSEARPLLDTRVSCACLTSCLSPEVHAFDFWPSSCSSMPKELANLAVEYACPPRMGRGCTACLRNVTLLEMGAPDVAERICIPSETLTSNIPVINNLCTRWELTHLYEAVAGAEACLFSNQYVANKICSVLRQIKLGTLASRLTAGDALRIALHSIMSASEMDQSKHFHKKQQRQSRRIDTHFTSRLITPEEQQSDVRAATRMSQGTEAEWSIIAHAQGKAQVYS
jgi:hypothetical protein